MTAGRSETGRMLILACSRRKRLEEGHLPAVERYDGPAFRVLRRFMRESPSEAPDVLILSAEHGLIPHDLPIAIYDRQMTPARARELRPRVLAELDRVVGGGSSRETLVFAGRHYLTALGVDATSSVLGPNARACAGGLGGKLSELHDWLHGGPPGLRRRLAVPANAGGLRIRGVEVCFTPEQVSQAAREALAEGWGNPERYESWCVSVDGRRVAPKCLVSRISGLPVGAFTTDDARRLLAQLGVEVRRA